MVKARQVRAAETYTVRHRVSHTPGAGIWTSEALPAPTSRHLRGEAWPREQMHEGYERRGTEHAGVQVADDQPSSALRYSIPPFSVIDVGKFSVTSRTSRPFSYSMMMLRCTKIVC
jgi:hypothetical protein